MGFDSLTRLSKLKNFDFNSFKTDFEKYLINNKYLKETQHYWKRN